MKANELWEIQQKYQLTLIRKFTNCFRVNTRQIQATFVISLIEEIDSKENKAKSDDADILHKIVEFD
jgi:hypothetical protein